MTSYKPHEDDSRYDYIELKSVERWKESELSGDEWRFSFVALFYKKGFVLKRLGGLNMMDLISEVGSVRDRGNSGDDPELLEAAGDLNRFCFQPACIELATIEYRLTDAWCRHGNKEYTYTGRDIRRRYCNKHKGRGDCALEDSDANYTTVAKLDENGIWVEVTA